MILNSKELAARRRTFAPPSLPYKVDTSRPSLRTNWTRLESTGRTFNLGDDEPATSVEVAAFARAVGPRTVRKCRTAKPKLSAQALNCSSAERRTHCAQLLREAGERLPPVGAEPPLRARRGGGLRAMRRDNKRVLPHRLRIRR